MGEKRKYEHIAVEAQHPAVQVMAAQPTERYADWGDMRVAMLSRIGIQNGEQTADPELVQNEVCYVVAKTPHPSKTDVVVCLVEKSRGKGYALMPEDALEATGGEGHVTVEQIGHQFTGWAAMEEKLGVTGSDYKAQVGDTGVIVARAPHLKDEDVQVFAVLIPSQCTPEARCTVLLKEIACKVLPTDMVSLADPGERYNRWPEMADILGIDEPKPAPILRRGMLGVAHKETQHFVQNDATVVAVELLDGGDFVMMKKNALRTVKA